VNELALFAGAGGGILGGKLLGWRTVCAVELDAYCRRVLLARQRDGFLPRFPIWDDVQTFDGKPWRGGWMLSVEDSHAPTYHKQSKTREASTATKADCGEKWRESLAKFDPDSFSWRTRQCLLFEDLGECLEIWPEWGSAHGTEFWERATLALPTTEGASGSWVTPNARDWKDSINMETKRKDGRCKIDQTSRQAFQFWKARGEGQSLPRAKTGRCATYSPDFAEWLMGWPIGWTDLKPLATDKFQQWLRSHGVCLEGRNDL
jgi:DNA (cytosine-5)-methyltransferase 1